MRYRPALHHRPSAPTRLARWRHPSTEHGLRSHGLAKRTRRTQPLRPAHPGRTPPSACAAPIPRINLQGQKLPHRHPPPGLSNKRIRSRLRFAMRDLSLLVRHHCTSNCRLNESLSPSIVERLTSMNAVRSPTIVEPSGITTLKTFSSGLPCIKTISCRVNS